MIKRLFGSLQATRLLERLRLPDRSAISSTNSDTLWRESLREMARHFPPSGTELRLLTTFDNEKFILQLLEFRPDLSITVVRFTHALVKRNNKSILDRLLWAYDSFLFRPAKLNNPPVLDSVQWIDSSGCCIPFADNSFDVIAVPPHTVMYKGGGWAHIKHLQKTELRVLRPGGRLITLMIHNGLSEAKYLIDAGFARVLAENILDSYCTLVRGEKPYTQRSTVERIAQTSARDESNDGEQIVSPEMLETANKGKFLFLLVHQIPDKPAWALKPDEPIRWRAAMVNDQTGQSYLLAFTSLNKAVEFMQSAVTSNTIQGINKVAKYPKATVRDYATDLLLNPPFDLVREHYPYTGIMLDVDPQRAVTGEE